MTAFGCGGRQIGVGPRFRTKRCVQWLVGWFLVGCMQASFILSDDSEVYPGGAQEVFLPSFLPSFPSFLPSCLTEREKEREDSTLAAQKGGGGGGGGGTLCVVKASKPCQCKMSKHQAKESQNSVSPVRRPLSPLNIMRNLRRRVESAELIRLGVKGSTWAVKKSLRVLPRGCRNPRAYLH